MNTAGFYAIRPHQFNYQTTLVIKSNTIFSPRSFFYLIESCDRWRRCHRTDVPFYTPYTRIGTLWFRCIPCDPPCSRVIYIYLCAPIIKYTSHNRLWRLMVQNKPHLASHLRSSHLISGSPNCSQRVSNASQSKRGIMAARQRRATTTGHNTKKNPLSTFFPSVRTTCFVFLSIYILSTRIRLI